MLNAIVSGVAPLPHAGCLSRSRAVVVCRCTGAAHRSGGRLPGRDAEPGQRLHGVAGLAAEDVERLLTTPIETALAGLPGVEVIRSVSLFGLSYVGVYFRDDVDIWFARRLVGERIAEARSRLPEGYGEPSLGPNSFRAWAGVLVHDRVSGQEAERDGAAHAS